MLSLSPPSLTQYVIDIAMLAVVLALVIAVFKFLRR